MFLALSTLQNGRLPRLMSEDVLQEVFISDSPRPFAQDLRKGLDSLGLIQVSIIYYVPNRLCHL